MLVIWFETVSSSTGVQSVALCGAVLYTNCIRDTFIPVTDIRAHNITNVLLTLCDIVLDYHSILGGIVLGPLFSFLLYVNDITKLSTNGAKIFLYVDDTSIIATNPDYNGYKLTMNKVFHEVSKWFKINLLSLNLKTLITYSLKQLTKMIQIWMLALVTNRYSALTVLNCWA